MMNDILTIQRYVLSMFIQNMHTEKISLLNKNCFDGKHAELYLQVNKQYLETGSVDMALIDFDFSEMVDMMNESMVLNMTMESCISKLNNHRGDKANKYIGTKLISGELTEVEAIDLLNKKLEIIEEDVSNGMTIAVETYSKIMQQIEKKTQFKTGLKNFDRILPDLSEAGFFVLGGRPSSGKTALALNIIEILAKQNQKVLFFSLEMTKYKIMQRMLVTSAGVDNNKIREQTITPDEIQKIYDSCKSDYLKNIHIIDKANITIDEIISKSVSLNKRHHYTMIVVDYLQLVKASGGNKREEMINVSHGFVALKKMLDIPVLVVSSLSRANQGRADKRPIMSDLAEAGAIEFDADTVAFVHRDFIEDNTADPCNAEIIFRKQRDGMLGIAKQYYKGEWFRFMNWQY